MNPLITLSDTLIGAIVPEDAHDFEYSKNGNFIDYYVLDRGPLGKEVKFIPLPPGKWEILFEVYSDACMQDYSHIVLIKKETGFDSVFPLLASKDIYWVNPDPKPNPKDFDIYGVWDAADRFFEAEKQWQRKQSNAESMKGNKVVVCAKIG
jgi:hypothetical protein